MDASFGVKSGKPGKRMKHRDGVKMDGVNELRQGSSKAWLQRLQVSEGCDEKLEGQEEETQYLLAIGTKKRKGKSGNI